MIRDSRYFSNKKNVTCVDPESTPQKNIIASGINPKYNRKIKNKKKKKIIQPEKTAPNGGIVID